MPNLNAQLRKYLKERDSPLAAHVPTLIQAGRRHRVDPRLIVAISAAETSLGKAGAGPAVHNAWGIGPGRKYGSWAEGINEMAKLLRTGYLNEGRNSFTALYPKYVWGKTTKAGDPEADWVRNASSVYSALGGNPANVTRGWQNASAPATTRVQRGAAPLPQGWPGGQEDSGMPDFTLSALKRVAAGGSAVAAFRSMVTGPERWRRAHPAPAPAQVQPTSAPDVPAGQVVNAPKSGNVVRPMVTKPGGSAFTSPDAEGAPDAKGVRRHAAMDWFAPGGSRVLSPVGGKIVEVKASRGNSGQVFGGVVKIQQPNGRVFVFRHVDPRGVKLGQQVKPGTVIAGVSPWRDGSPHAHIEVWKTLDGGYRYENMLDPAQFFR